MKMVLMNSSYGMLEILILKVQHTVLMNSNNKKSDEPKRVIAFFSVNHYKTEIVSTKSSEIIFTATTGRFIIVSSACLYIITCPLYRRINSS